MKKNLERSAVHARPRPGRFAQRLLAEWKRLALPMVGERVVVAVSGGADSTALLLALDELGQTSRLTLKLTVAHLDHSLRGRAGGADARWVAELAARLGCEIELGKAPVKRRAVETGDNLEQAARRARYCFLAGVADKTGARVVLTAHTLDDQAETVLMRLLRGSGAEGLGGMEPVRALDSQSGVVLARPLLRWARRAETESYCLEREVSFRRDEMNEDERFARVRVRRRLLPLMESFNPRAAESLARTAELLREDAAFLTTAAEELLKTAGEAGEGATDGSGVATGETLDVNVLARAAAAVRRRALRLWISSGRGDLRRLELVHLLGVEKLLEGERGNRRAELPGGSFVERRRGRLRLHVK
ncbi:MAG TPA: tRNA lysidine(34) synthetase TilS [Pyrinomonadaceae bacterium]|nr:tRNA lysidine(34) synthetase TilS [Pyrinomonadaceae bacterium]